ncbi:MAG: hypothetical protein E7109_04700 [Bacteroidales bacterium]|jgi:hypothetical protein|nr:hypothetical protein [Bacteroidales bacterium]
MKKIITFALGAALAFNAAAQTWQDALLFSENNYSGTARGVGMGNALTAIGGDAGSLVFNPAGSATASYSQFVITPAVTLSFANTGASADNLESFKGQAISNTYARMKLPNVGFIMNIKTGRRSGLKNVAWGVVVNSTNNFTGRYKAAGVNADNSYAASLASLAQFYSKGFIEDRDSYYNKEQLDQQFYPAWSALTGYHSGMIDWVKDNEREYVAITEVMEEKEGGEKEYYLAAPVDQQYGQQRYGYKTDAVLNFAMNFSDKLYIGANLGLTILSYALSEFWYEAPNRPEDFPIIRYSTGTSTQFESLRMNRQYRLSGTGLFFKAGFLWRPVSGVRLGAAIQTPTLLNLRERYGYSGQVNLKGIFASNASSPEDEFIYALTSPFRFNLGAAYTFGNRAVLSADYEFVDYSQARFRSRTSNNEYGTGWFGKTNQEISQLMGISHEIRIGMEVKLSPDVSIRGGYNLTTGAQYSFLDNDDNLVRLSSADRVLQLKHGASLGVGYSFGGLFIDAAVRGRFVPQDKVIAYDYFYTPYPKADYSEKKVDYDVLTPEYIVNNVFVDILLTLGWRF